MNDKRLFVISCFYDGSNDAIFNCTNSILEYYENPKIVVVDSDSPDKSYFDYLKSKSIEILDIIIMITTIFYKTQLRSKKI